MPMTKGTQSAECSTTRPTCRLFLQQEAIFVNCERALRAEKWRWTTATADRATSRRQFQIQNAIIMCATARTFKTARAQRPAAPKPADNISKPNPRRQQEPAKHHHRRRRDTTGAVPPLPPHHPTITHYRCFVLLIHF
jgi:hypothetical protein